MAVGLDNQFWREFISMFKEMPELWQVSSEAYKDRRRRNSAYEKLVNFLKIKDRNANVETVKRKLNTLRGSYRRERKRVLASSEERYVSSLWYYHDLEFLNDQEIDEDVSSSFESVDEKPILVKSESYGRATKCQKLSNDCSSQRPTTDGDIDDCADLYAKAWAVQFRRIAPDQQIHVKRAMEEILYQGLLGNLSQIQSIPHNGYRPKSPVATSTPLSHHSTACDTHTFKMPDFEISTGDEIEKSSLVVQCELVYTESDKQTYQQVSSTDHSFFDSSNLNSF